MENEVEWLCLASCWAAAVLSLFVFLLPTLLCRQHTSVHGCVSCLLAYGCTGHCEDILGKDQLGWVGLILAWFLLLTAKCIASFC